MDITQNFGAIAIVTIPRMDIFVIIKRHLRTPMRIRCHLIFIDIHIIPSIVGIRKINPA